MKSVALEEFPRRDIQPFRKEPLIKGNTFIRYLAAQVLAQRKKASLSSVIAECWPNDLILDLVARATSAPATTTTTGWAAELAVKLVNDGLAGLAPMSAGTQLLQDGVVLTFDGYGSISAPGIAASASNAGFIAEGQPIPVKQLVASAATLLPYKLAAIAALTQEMIDSSNAETLIGDALTRSAGMALDAVLFDSNAATAARPAGLRNGISGSTASNSTDFYQAIGEDLATLMNVVTAVGGPGPYYVVASPGRVVGAQSRLAVIGSENALVKFLGSASMGNDIMVVAAKALVAAFSPTPDIETGNASTLVMEDTSPATPDTTQPTKSMYQTNSVAIKMRWPVSWALRDSRGVAWLTPTWK